MQFIAAHHFETGVDNSFLTIDGTLFYGAVRRSLGHRFLLQLAEVMIEPRRAVRRPGQSHVEILTSAG